MNVRRGSGQRLGSPASFDAHVRARVKESARIARLTRIQCRPIKVITLPARAAGERRRV